MKGQTKFNSIAGQAPVWLVSSRSTWNPPATQLQVNVVYTTSGETLEALKMAAGLAASLEARVNFFAAHAAPFELEMSQPPISVEFLREKYRALAEQASAEVGVHVFFCRDKIAALRRALHPRSLVILGGQRGLWPSWRTKLIRKLAQDGHRVILSRGW